MKEKELIEFCKKTRLLSNRDTDRTVVIVFKEVLDNSKKSDFISKLLSSRLSLKQFQIKRKHAIHRRPRRPIHQNSGGTWNSVSQRKCRDTKNHGHTNQSCCRFPRR